MGTQSFFSQTRRILGPVVAVMLLALPALRAQAVSALMQPLRLPSALAYDAQGNLYIAETGNHVIRVISPSGALSTLAGTGVQGFSGDGQTAMDANLDSPAGVAVDASGNVYVADSHNQRVRRVDALTGLIATVAGTGVAGFGGDGGAATAARLSLPTAIALDGSGNLYIADTRNHRVRMVSVGGVITTVAGNGTEGFSGDGGLATAASLDSPAGLAVDAAGNLYLADSHNQRVRRVDPATGIITTVMGSGAAGFAGDAGGAAYARLNLPRGIAVDAAGNLYVADLQNERIRRADGTTGVASTTAGQGTQGFAGDGQAAVAANLDGPRAVTISPAGLVTLADTANGRVRQIDAASVIRTIGGVGAVNSGTLSLAGGPGVVYGTGSVTATLTPSAASGSVSFTDVFAGSSGVLGKVSLSSNAAVLDVSSLVVGTHEIYASYSGDGTHLSAQAGPLTLLVSPAVIVATPNPVAILYGQVVPALTGAVAGVIARDVSSVGVTFTSAAGQFSVPGSYPITAVLSGSSSGNYTLQVGATQVIVGQAPSVVSLGANGTSVAPGAPITVNLQVMSATAGTPTGRVTLLDGGAPPVTSSSAAVPLGTAALNGAGSASFTLTSLGQGGHTLSAVYTGDADFVGSSAGPVVVTVGTAAAPDFSLAATGATTHVVASGGAATYSFAVTPIASQGVTLSSPVLLAASGLPFGATASFSPAYLPPGAASASFVLTIQTPLVARLRQLAPTVLLVLVVPFVRIKRRGWVVLCAMALLAGCGARVNLGTRAAAASTSYDVVVTASATGAGGAAVVHAATVVLTVQ